MGVTMETDISWYTLLLTCRWLHLALNIRTHTARVARLKWRMLPTLSVCSVRFEPTNHANFKTKQLSRDLPAPSGIEIVCISQRRCQISWSLCIMSPAEPSQVLFKALTRGRRWHWALLLRVPNIAKSGGTHKPEMKQLNGTHCCLPAAVQWCWTYIW